MYPETEYGPYWGDDKIKWVAIAISPFAPTPFVFYDVLEFSTSKDDSGDAGQFSLTIPYVDPYTQTGQPNPVVKAYASVMGPMDLVAIYAFRTRVDDPNTIPLGPTGSTLDALNTNLSYGDLASMVAMGSASCVMIGLADNPVEVPLTMSDQPSAHISISGKDLTKIFYMNDANVPAASIAYLSAIYQNALTIVLSGPTSGTQLLLNVLDLVVTKDIELAVPALEVTPDENQTFLAYGFPWRNFVRTDALDPTFQNLSYSNFPPFSVTTGSTWANAMELRNPPAFRLFVNEIGQLIFDSAINAWTTQTPTGVLNASDIYDCQISMDDADLITFLTVIPYGAMSAQYAVEFVKGYAASLGFAGGISDAQALTSEQIVKTYGFRSATFEAFYAISTADAEVQRKAVQLYHNSLFRMHLVIRGSTAWRVGQRITVPVKTAKAATTNQPWYIEHIEHSGSFGQDWRTTLSLRFPGGK
jgi:hypothetical protein